MKPAVSGALLSTPAQWDLPLNATKAPLLKVAACLLTLSSIALLLAWCAEVFRDLRSGRELGLIWSLGLVGLGLWLRLAWRSYDQTSTDDDRGCVTLAWGGLPPSPRQLSKPKFNAPSDSCLMPGWSLKQWEQPVKAQVVFDFGTWMLLRIESASHPQKPSRLVWSWVQPEHRLRALLMNDRAHQIQHSTPILGRVSTKSRIHRADDDFPSTIIDVRSSS